MSFNLVDEPWIPAQTLSGPREFSLADVFRHAEDIRMLGGDIPTQAFANLRLLLAICHDAIGWHTIDAVIDLHDEGLDIAPIDGYLQHHHDRFDLFDPERPFMQVAGLHTAKGQHSGLEKLIADVPNGAPLFTTRAGRGLDSITAAEAARWLIHAHAFDPSGIRSAAVGDTLSSKGKGYPIGPGWAGQTGGVVLHGRNLLETLKLNLTHTPNNPDDVPVWRQEPAQTAQRSEETTPAGPVQTLVWQSRRMRLIGDMHGVHGIILCQGDKVSPQTMLPFEPMTAWRYSTPQSKKFGRPIYMPNEHEPGRSMWRGLPALVSDASGQVEDAYGSHDQFRPPATVVEADSNEERFILQIIGMQYGAQNATIEEIIDDTMELSSVLLSDEAVEARIAIKDGVENADACVRIVGQLAANIARANGEKGDGAGDAARNQAKESMWAELDPLARRWIGGLDSPTIPTETKADWQRTLRHVATEHAERLVDTAGPAAIRGRETSFGFTSAHSAYSRFLSALRKELPLAYPAKEDSHA